MHLANFMTVRMGYGSSEKRAAIAAGMSASRGTERRLERRGRNGFGKERQSQLQNKREREAYSMFKKRVALFSDAPFVFERG